MMASQVLRGLEKRDLLARTVHAADSRAKAVVLTPEGQRILNDALPVVETEDAGFFAGLGSDVPAFTAALGRLGGTRARVRMKIVGAGRPLQSQN